MTDKPISSPIRYPGGKSKLIKELERLSPDSYKEYREPFFGGGSYMFHIAQTKPKTIIKRGSDNFFLLSNFWSHVINSPQELIDKIKEFKSNYSTGKELFVEMKKLVDINNYSKEYPLDIAAAFFILNRCSFSGGTLSAGFSQASYEGRFKENHIDAILKAHKALDSTQLFYGSYEKLLFDEGEDVFIYLDPPYFLTKDKSNLYGKNGNMHKDFDHIKFVDNVKKQIKHKMLISYNDSEQVRELFKDVGTINEVNVNYSMKQGNNVNKKELFITINY